MSQGRVGVMTAMLLAVVGGTGWLAARAMPLRVTGPDQRVLLAGDPDTSRSYVVSGFSNTGALPEAIGRTPAAQAATPKATAARRQIKPSFAEYPQEALEKRIRGIVFVEITINPAGDVTTGAVTSGPQELRLAAFKAALGLKYEPGPVTTMMRVAFEFHLDDREWGIRIVDASMPDAMSGQISAGGTGGDASGAVRVGGNIRAPRKLKDVAPVYPAVAREARAQGVVILEVTVDEGGNVSNTRTLRSVPLLDQAAIDAVKQWTYTPTLLNGVAVPVIMTVTVNFTLRSQVRLKITMPDGTLVALGITPNGGIGRTKYPAMSGFGFAPFLDPDPSVDTVKVVIYEFDEVGTAPRQLGDVELTPSGGLVQSATTPSFGIALVSVERN